MRSGEVLCTGSLLAYNKILTAAHCNVQNSTMAAHEVIIGSNHFENVKRYPIVRIFRHKNFSVGHRGEPINDIAILEVYRPIPRNSSNKTNQAVTYPTINVNHSFPVPSTKLQVSGFGRYHALSGPSKKLRTTSVRVISKSQCAGFAAFNGMKLENRICAFSRGKDACVGDSGAALYAYGVIYGTVSFGIACAHPTLPAIYTRISTYSDWISAVLARKPTPYIKSNDLLGGNSLKKEKACFPGNARVHIFAPLQNSIEIEIPMRSLRVGMKVKTGYNSYSPVFMFSHAETTGTYPFIVLNNLTLSAGHFVYTVGKGLIPARNVKIGDHLINNANTYKNLEKVTNIHHTREKGLFNPHTLDGTLIVNGYLSSTYTEAIPESVANSLLLPFRMFYSVFGRDLSTGKLE